MTPDDVMLQVENLQVEFKTRRGTALVLNGVSFELRHGETLCVVGESGCGKSMTALALMRLLPDSGAVRVAATSPNPNMVVVRATAALVEPLMAVFQAVWAPWRAAAWGLATEAPRIWRI